MGRIFRDEVTHAESRSPRKLLQPVLRLRRGRLRAGWKKLLQRGLREPDLGGTRAVALPLRPCALRRLSQ